MARQYHPDKNPEGRDKFMAVQKAYERLQAGSRAGQGAQPWRLQLLLKVSILSARQLSFGIISTPKHICQQSVYTLYDSPCAIAEQLATKSYRSTSSKPCVTLYPPS